jgi:hemoglobin-like flavoprotein
LAPNAQVTSACRCRDQTARDGDGNHRACAVDLRSARAARVGRELRAARLHPGWHCGFRLSSTGPSATMLPRAKEVSMGLNASLLRSSFDLVIERQPQLTTRFYDVLFERYPQSKRLFTRNSRAKQDKMLADALVAVLDHLEDASWLTTTLGALGQKHVEYGVTREMYGWVGECLLATLAEVAGPAWTPELKAAWTEAYGAITSLMLKDVAAATAR